MRKLKIITGSALVLSLVLSGCSSPAVSPQNSAPDSSLSSSALSGDSSAEITGKMELQYAEQFSVSYRSDGCAEIISGNEKFLFVPDTASEPSENTLPVIHEVHDSLYLAASSAMDLFFAMSAENCIEFTSTTASNWSLPEIRKAVEDEDIFYVGKYSAPDYEFLLSEGCTLAVESTMINHSPEVKEMLQSLGITVFTERSSYETHPLGRLEWIRLYGLITGRQDEADAFFEEKLKTFEQVQQNAETVTDRKTVAFFYVTSAGYISVRKPGDYVTKMIELAGGQYAFTNEQLGTGENEMSTVNMQMEEFYRTAKDADIIIYNSTIDGALTSKEQLLEKSELFADFRAFSEDSVYCTGQNMFQQTSECADMIMEINTVLEKNTDEGLRFLKKLN